MDALKASFMKTKKNVDLQTPSSLKDDETLSSSISLNSSSRSASSSVRGGGSGNEMQCVKSLSAFCRENDHDVYSDLMFRIAHFHDFNFEKSKHTVITCASNKYLNLRMEGDLEKHFAKRIIFPLPHLKAKDKSNVVYLRPSRYPGNKKKSSQLMVESLCYVLNDLSRTQS